MAEEAEELNKARQETVRMPLVVPKNLAKNLPFKSKSKVAIINDPENENRRRRTNLLQKLNLPTVRPFKNQFMNENDKKIYSLVQRLGTIQKVTKKEAHDKLQKRIAEKQKVADKRDQIVQKSLTEKKKKRFAKLQHKGKYKAKNKD